MYYSLLTFKYILVIVLCLLPSLQNIPIVSSGGCICIRQQLSSLQSWEAFIHLSSSMQVEPHGDHLRTPRWDCDSLFPFFFFVCMCVYKYIHTFESACRGPGWLLELRQSLPIKPRVHRYSWPCYPACSGESPSHLRLELQQSSMWVSEDPDSSPHVSTANTFITGHPFSSGVCYFPRQGMS